MDQTVCTLSNHCNMSPSFLHSIFLFAFESIIIFAIVFIGMCMLKSTTKENKLTQKKFRVTKYKNINEIDKKIFTHVCVNNCKKKDDTPKEFFLKRLIKRIFTKKQPKSLLQESPQETQPKTKYLLYTFNNLSNTSKNDEFEKLQNFVDITINTCDPKLFEILLKISSPGGVAYQFEKAYLSVLRLKNKGYKLTALVDDVCASGGYMLACACNKIIASQYAKIGSVGVRADTINCHTLLKDKLGVDHRTFKTGDYKDIIPFGDKCDLEDITRMKELLNDTLLDFSNIVQAQRKLSDDQMKIVLSAKVWNGETAKKHGLVDDINLFDTYLEFLTTSTFDEIFVVTSDDENESMIKDLLSMSCNKLIKIFYNKLTLNSSSYNNVFL